MSALTELKGGTVLRHIDILTMLNQAEPSVRQHPALVSAFIRSYCLV